MSNLDHSHEVEKPSKHEFLNNNYSVCVLLQGIGMMQPQGVRMSGNMGMMNSQVSH